MVPGDNEFGAPGQGAEDAAGGEATRTRERKGFSRECLESVGGLAFVLEWQIWHDELWVKISESHCVNKIKHNEPGEKAVAS